MIPALIILIIILVIIMILLTPHYEKIGNLFMNRVIDSKKEQQEVEEIEVRTKEDNKSV